MLLYHAYIGGNLYGELIFDTFVIEPAACEGVCM